MLDLGGPSWALLGWAVCAEAARCGPGRGLRGAGAGRGGDHRERRRGKRGGGGDGQWVPPARVWEATPQQ